MADEFDIKTEETKDLVWLPKSLAELIKKVQSEELLRESVLKYVKETKEYLKDDFESFQKAELEYRVSLEKIKSSFKETKESELNALYDMWEGFEKDIIKIKANNKKVIEELQPLKNELEEIKSLMSQLSKWNLEDFLKILEKINGMDDKTMEILNFLFENYKHKGQ